MPLLWADPFIARFPAGSQSFACGWRRFSEQGRESASISENSTTKRELPGPILAPPNLTAEENAQVLEATPLARWGGAEEIAKTVMFFVETR